MNPTGKTDFGVFMTVPSTHDIRLLGIPVAFAGCYLLGTIVLPSQQLALAAASLVSVVIVADCLFLHPPGNG